MTLCLEFTVLHDVYKTKTIYTKLPSGEEYPETKQVLIKTIKVKKWFQREAIVSIEQYVTKRHSIGKSRAIIFDKFSQRSYIVLHTPQDILHMITEPLNPIGFRHEHTNIYPAKTQVRKY